MVETWEDEEGSGWTERQEEDGEYRLHRHEGTEGIVYCAIDEARNEAAGQKKYICVSGGYVDGEMLLESTDR